MKELVKAETIPHQISATDMPDIFVATVKRITEKDNKSNRPTVQVELAMQDNKTAIISYSRPKVLTGNSQLDLLFAQLAKLGLPMDTEVMAGKTFKWQRQILPGSMKGFARHYPIEIVSVEASASA